MTCAESGLLQVRWSAGVVDEAVRAIVRISPGLDEATVGRRFAAMDAALPGSFVSDGRVVIDCDGFPDPDDQHVVASAVSCGADVVVTANVRDFPKELMAGFGLTVMSPDDLLLSLLKENTASVLTVVIAVAAALHHPARSVEDILTILGRSGAPGFAAGVRRLL